MRAMKVGVAVPGAARRFYGSGDTARAREPFLPPQASPSAHRPSRQRLRRPTLARARAAASRALGAGSGSLPAAASTATRRRQPTGPRHATDAAQEGAAGRLAATRAGQLASILPTASPSPGEPADVSEGLLVTGQPVHGCWCAVLAEN